MLSFAWFLVVGLGYALPQDCVTSTKQVIVPTSTATYTTTPVVTIHATGAKDLGTFTLTTTISVTKTLETITNTHGVCGSTNGVLTVPAETTTTYTNAPTPYAKRGLGLNPRDDCTVTVSSTTTYGQTYTFVPANSTSTFYDYTAFTQATVISTKTGGKAYEIGTAGATTTTACGASTAVEAGATSTVTLDARCSPSAMVSAYNGFGIEWLSDTPASGATFETTTDDASACCQLCAEAEKCAASAWDIRSGACKLEFPVDYSSGNLNCGEGVLAYYDAGPNSPMAPGTGWFVAELCGNAQFSNAKPDDGS